MALVARNKWMRGRPASFNARHAVSMSPRVQRARPAMIGPWTSRATRFTDSQSPGEAIGKPASMMSTPSSASAFATRSFSAWVMLQPGDCSPSRSVVSKTRTRLGSIMVSFDASRRVHIGHTGEAQLGDRHLPHFELLNFPGHGHGELAGEPDIPGD